MQQPGDTVTSGKRGFARGIARGLGFLLRLGAVGWATLAIYWSNLPWPWARLALAVAFLAFGIWALWFARKPLVFSAAFLAVLVWWLAIPPSDDREWRPEVALKPHATIDGDTVRISNFRNFSFHGRDDFTVGWEEREVQLSHLVGVDFFLSFWMKGPVGHTWVSFVFDNAPPVSISIETRPEVGEGFDPLASMFRQFELIYVVGDEKDLVGLRTVRHEQSYLFRVQASPEAARNLFLVYLERINELDERPEWYNLLSNNCTLNIVRYMNRVGRDGGFRPSHLLNGLFDSYLHSRGFLDTTLPLEQLRARSRISDKARSVAGAPNFSELIRQGLPGVAERAASRSRAEAPVEPRVE
jgi:Domain of unknown function (DUF4105)